MRNCAGNLADLRTDGSARLQGLRGQAGCFRRAHLFLTLEREIPNWITAVEATVIRQRSQERRPRARYGITYPLRRLPAYPGPTFTYAEAPLPNCVKAVVDGLPSTAYGTAGRLCGRRLDVTPIIAVIAGLMAG